MDTAFLFGFAKRVVRWFATAWMEATLTVVSVATMAISLLLPFTVPGVDPAAVVNLSILGVLSFIFALRMRQFRVERKETLEHLERLANSAFTFRSHIRFPLGEAELLPSAKYIMEIAPEAEGWVMFLRTSYPISTNDEVPAPGTPEEKITKRVLRIESRKRPDYPAQVEMTLQESLIDTQSPLWAKEWKAENIWARTYRNEGASLGVIVQGPLLATAAAVRTLDAMMMMFVQALIFAEAQIRDSRRWANRSEAELIRSALIHEQAQELQMLRNILPTDQTRDTLFGAWESLQAGNIQNAKDAIRPLLPTFDLYPSAVKHLEFASMYSEQLSQVKDISQDWMHVSLRPMPLHTILQDLRSSLRLMYKSVNFYPAEGPKEIWVEADTQLRGLFRNLLFNAAQASPENGEVRVRVQEDSPWYAVTIQDQGPGVSEGLEERIFEPRFSLDAGKETSHRFEKHMGLGLFFARYVARAYGGEIRCEKSTEGAGAQFVIRLRKSRKDGG